MARKPVSVSLLQSKKGSEEAYFAERDQKLLRQLREKTSKEANESYSEDHKYHCFRCGTASLVEIDEGNVKIDICVNENCGALHLDPGELKELLNNQQSLPSARKAFLSIFNK
jgi:hypothetical protein